jgi:hypothetical protein
MALNYHENLDFSKYGQHSPAWTDFLKLFPSADLYRTRMEDFFTWYEAEVNKRTVGRETWVIESYLILYFDEKR